MSPKYDLSPEAYFDALRTSGGLQVKVEKETTPASTVAGTVRRRRMSRYNAWLNVKGNILSVTGDVHVIGDEVIISAEVTMTKSLRTACGVTGVKKFKNVCVKNLLDVLFYARVCEEMDECRDYTLGGGS